MKNILGYQLKNNASTDLTFEQLQPAVKWVGKGVILPRMDIPNTQGLVMPFEAVNLKAVDVTITQIFEKNIAQFFQVNRYDGQRELKRVARPVVKKTISLQSAGVTDLGRWNRFTLDLSEIIRTEPGAIYQVKLSFRQPQAVYSCDDATVAEQPLEDNTDWDNPDAEDDYYEYEGDYYYPPGYDWEERDNPCNISYYNYNRFIERNVFASDLGLIAKKGKGKEVFVAATDLKTASPLADIKVQLYDYQQRPVAEAQTDAEGIAPTRA